MNTLSSLITYCRIAGYEITHTKIYNDKMTIESGGHLNGNTVYHTTISRPDRTFGEIAHIIHRSNGAGEVLGMLSADIHFADGTVFIKNAKLSQLADYLT